MGRLRFAHPIPEEVVMRLLTVLLASLTLLAGCGQTFQAKRGTDSPYYAPPVGTSIRLHKALTVPGGHTRVFLQRGEVVSKQAFDRYVPNCNFEINTLSEQPREIRPESFIVVRVQPETSEVVRNSQSRMLASLVLAMEDYSTPMVVRGLHLWIASDLQPDVRRLTCRGAFDDMPRADPPSIDEMREALGDYAELVLP
jgi:hypothetical protein